MVRLWCRAYAPEIDLAVDYQPWMIAKFLGHRACGRGVPGRPGRLLAVDRAAPDGDRLVGYTLLPKTSEVDQSTVRSFIARQMAVGVNPDPDGVITDDSRL